MWQSPGSVKLGPKVPSSFFRDTLEKHFVKASSRYNVNKIFVCSEMHGFCLKDPNTGRLTDYFSWRHSQKDDHVIVETLTRDKFFEISGVMARPGLPIVNLIGSCHTYLNDGYSQVLFLPHLLCDSLDDLPPRAHPTLAQASGIYDLKQTKISFLDPRYDIPLWDDHCDFPYIGHCTFEGRSVPIIGGYGDLQCSINMPQFEENKWFINLGTGSQVGILAEKNIEGFEKRFFFDKRVLQCKTHFPAGRALQFYAQFFAQIRQQVSTDFFWEGLRYVEPPSDFDRLPIFDLALFAEARGYRNGGSIGNIKESMFDLNSFLQGLVYSLAKSFADEINQLPPIVGQEVLLIGKMARSIPMLAQLLGELTRRNIQLVEQDQEASLLGLSYLSKRQET